MKRMKWIAVGILFFSTSAFAQQAPRVEVSASYSFLRLGGTGGTNQQGGSLSVAGNLNNWFGIAGDFGAYHSSPFGLSLTTYTFMAGPRFSRRGGKVTPFAQILLGGAHLNAATGGISAGTTPFALSVGGGVDVQVAKHIALRPQLDYIAMRSGGATLNAARGSFGIVFRFGGR